MDKKFVKETVVAVMIALVVAIAKLTFQSMGIYDFLFLGGVALYAFLGVFLIRQARLLEKAREQWLGEKRQKLISNRVWEHFKGKFECPDADFQGKILARYDLAPDKQAFNHKTPQTVFYSVPSCSNCLAPLIPITHDGLMGWAKGYKCRICKKVATEKSIQEFNELARSTFQGEMKKFLEECNA